MNLIQAIYKQSTIIVLDLLKKKDGLSFCNDGNDISILQLFTILCSPKFFQAMILSSQQPGDGEDKQYYLSLQMRKLRPRCLPKITGLKQK